MNAQYECGNPIANYDEWQRAESINKSNIRPKIKLCIISLKVNGTQQAQQNSQAANSTPHISIWVEKTRQKDRKKEWKRKARRETVKTIHTISSSGRRVL